MNTTNLLLLSILLSGFRGLSFAQNAPELYKTYCAGCHGANLEGGTSSALVKEDWIYGRSPGLFFRNIKYGIDSTEMIAWGQVLNDKQIRSLVSYIVDAQGQPPSTERSFPKTLETEDYKLSVEVLMRDSLEIPWGIEFINERKALITEQPGRLRWMLEGKLDPQEITGIPKVYDTGRGLGGLMDVAIDPKYETNGWVYLAYVHTEEDLQAPGSRAMTRIVRGKIVGHSWTEEQLLFSVEKSLELPKGTRWGCRLLFDREGYLYFTIGDVDREEFSQDLTRPNAKIYRIYSDGRIPEDNPFVGQEGAIEAIYGYGSRNAQGLSLHPATGEIWATEHGPMGGDELNVLKKGANYGWPLITYGKHYNGDIVSDQTEAEGMEQPIVQWTPSISVCPAEFCNSPLFPKWNNNLLVGALAFEEIRRLPIEGHSVLSQEVFLKNFGRVRDLKFGPDGALYVLVNRPDAVLRLVPTEP